MGSQTSIYTSTDGRQRGREMANPKSISTQFPRALGKKEILAGSTSLNLLKHFF